MQFYTSIFAICSFYFAHWTFAVGSVDDNAWRLALTTGGGEPWQTSDPVMTAVPGSSVRTGGRAASHFTLHTSSPGWISPSPARRSSRLSRWMTLSSQDRQPTPAPPPAPPPAQAQPSARRGNRSGPGKRLVAGRRREAGRGQLRLLYSVRWGHMDIYLFIFGFSELH